MKLSIIIPVLNQLHWTISILNEIQQKVKTPKEDYEIVIINDGSNEETTKRLTERVRGKDGTNKALWNNDGNKGVNYSWNRGVGLANGEYVWVINNDIYFIDGLDVVLLEVLQDTKIACPFTTRGIHKWKLPLFKPDANIAGWCFMLRKSDRVEIPKELFTWYGDNLLFDTYKDSIGRGGRCHHVESQSSDREYLGPITKKDGEAYKIISLTLGF